MHHYHQNTLPTLKNCFLRLITLDFWRNKAKIFFRREDRLFLKNLFQDFLGPKEMII